MANKTSLSAALKQVSASAPASRPADDAPSAQKNREGKKAVTAWFDPAVSRQLRQIAADTDSTIQDLMRDAINDLFAKHGRNRIA